MKKIIYICSKCDAQHPKWSGRCLECGAWGTLHESQKVEEKKSKKKLLSGSAAPAHVASLDALANVNVAYIRSNDFPAKAVFSKGIIVGSITLLAGEPGAGKSTLALQLAYNFSTTSKVLYITAEESLSHLKERSGRIGQFNQNFAVAESCELEQIIATAHAHKPQIIVIDSLQTVISQESESELGSINQIKIVTSALSQFARDRECAVILIGHVTKDGALAGPKSLEHLVDAVLYLESDRHSNYRLLRCYKNRYGASGTVVVMQLTSSGLKEVKDAATIFIHNFKAKPGSALTITVIENQPFFIEVQALVARSGFGYAKRTTSGFSRSRLELLLAIMKKTLHVDIDTYDVYVNIAGGFRASEPAMDVAVALSIVSSLQEKAVPEDTVVFGELGLSGELRIVKDTAFRLKEIEKQKFRRVILPPLDTKIKSRLTIGSFQSFPDVIKSLGW